MANKKLSAASFREMRLFVDSISMNFARFISCGIQAGLARTNFKNGIRAVLTCEGQNLPGK